MPDTAKGWREVAAQFGSRWESPYDSGPGWQTCDNQAQKTLYHKYKGLFSIITSD